MKEDILNVLNVNRNLFDESIDRIISENIDDFINKKIIKILYKRNKISLIAYLFAEKLIKIKKKEIKKYE